MSASSNKQIAKNTMFLYLRMIVSIVVNLYTVRLLWKVLGVDNYGIYNVVGGIVLMFAFLNNAMVASSQRFISFALGKDDKIQLQKTFSVSVSVHLLLALLILILAETIGMWFLNEKLNIPTHRMYAANWVFQCSVISFLINIISVPYNACIVAHEHMNVYGYFGILDVILKLSIVLIVAIIPFDPLICYAILILCVSALMRFIYTLYCRKHFEECKFKRINDKHLMKDMFSFAGWSFLGNMGFSVRDQGINILLNIFFNVAVNAAKGIANQVGGVINGFASNFTMAVNPQITKRYAAGEIDGMLNLLYNGCKFSLILMSIVVIPLIFCASSLLDLWLDDVAPYTIGFLQLVLLLSLVECVVSPITTSIQATGKIKKFQIVISLIIIANIPISWICLKMGGNPYCVMVISIILSLIGVFARLILLQEVVSFSYLHFLKKVYLRSIPYLLIAACTSYFYFQLITPTILGLAIYGVASISTIAILIYSIALSSSERNFIKKQIKKRISIL